MADAAFDQLIETGGSWLWAVGVLGGAALLGLLTHAVLVRGLRRIVRPTAEGPQLGEALLRRLPGPFRLLMPTLFVYGAFPVVR